MCFFSLNLELIELIRMYWCRWMVVQNLELCVKWFSNYFKVFHEFFLHCYSWNLIVFVYIKEIRRDSECDGDTGMNAMHLNKKTTTTKCRTYLFSMFRKCESTEYFRYLLFIYVLFIQIEIFEIHSQKSQTKSIWLTMWLSRDRYTYVWTIQKWSDHNKDHLKLCNFQYLFE